MKKLIGIKKQHYSYKYILIFVGVVIITLISIALYGYLDDIIKSEEEKNIQNLKEIKTDVAYKMDIINDTIYKVRINNIINVTSIFRDPYNRKKIIDELENLINTRDFIEEIVVFLDNEKYMFTSTTTCTIEQFWNDLYPYENWNKDEIQQQLSTVNQSIIRPSELVNQKGNKITFISPLTKNGITRYGSVMIIIDETKFVNDHLLNEWLYLRITDQNEQLIMEEGNMIPTNIGDLKLGYSYNIPYSKYVDKESSLKWTYTLISNNFDFNKVFTRIMIWSIVLIIVAVIIMSLIIKIIIRSFNKEMKNNKTPEELMRRYIIHKLLTQENVTETDLQAINMTGKYIVVSIISIHNLREKIDEILPLVKEKLANNDYFNGYIHSERNQLICIFSFEKPQMDKLVSILEQIQKELYQYANEDSIIGIGRIYEGYANISKSFMEATKALGYKIIYGHNEIFIYSEKKRDHITRENLPNEHINNLRKYIGYKDLEGVENSIKAIKDYIVRNYLPIYLVKAIGYNIIFEALKEIEQEATLKIKTKLIDLLGTLDDVVIDVFLISVSQICKEYIIENEEDNPYTIEKLMNYINTNYLDINFSTETMASYFNTTSANLCQIFKNLSGDTISEHVIILRLAKAKEILINTNLPIKSIAEEVGYYHVSSFIRRFKKIEGITPGEYRKINK